MRLLIVFARAYPWRSLAMLVCLLLATVAEGVGLSSLLPLLDLITKAHTRADLAAINTDGSTLERMVGQALIFCGLSPTIGSLLLLIVGGITIKAGLVLLAKKQVGYTVAHVATDLRLALIRSLMAAQWPYYVRQPAGALANAFATEASRAAEAYLYGTTIVAMALQAALAMTVASLVSWEATLGGISAGLGSIYVLGRLVRKTKKAGRKQTDVLKTLISRLTDVLYAVKPLKAMARETLVGPLLEKETERLNRALRRQVLSKETLNALQEPILVATIAGGLYVGLKWWSLPLDKVILLALLFSRALSGINKVQKQYQSMMACESAFWSLRATIDRSEAECELATGTRPPVLEREIVFRDVTFSYGDRNILTDVTMSFPAGRVTALVGVSGAGKTSIVDLMIGLVRPQSGQILVDDTRLSDIDLRAWRRTVGYVPQESLLLHESVFVNVTLGDPELTEADAERALRTAGAWEFVTAMPEGIHTELGERGARVSGGQRQRVAIARALVHDPKLLILDEATASLDRDSEAAVCDTVRSLHGDVTIVVISHQPALLETADSIYRLEGGAARRVENEPRAASAGARRR